MPTRRRLLAALTAAIAGCGTRRRSQQREPNASPPPAPMNYEPGTPTTPTPRGEPLPVDQSFRWPAPLYDAANTARPDTEGPTHSPTVQWEVWLPSGQETRAAVIDGRWLYVVGDRAVAAIDRREGWLARTTSLPVDLRTATSLTDRGFVAGAPTAQRDVGTALVGRHGTLRWRRTGGSLRIPPVVDGERIVQVDGGELIARSLSKGDVAWRHRADDGERFVAMPAVASGTVFGHSSTSLYAVDADSGERTWRTPAGMDAGPETAVSVAGGRVFVGYGDSETGSTAAFDGETGDRIFQRQSDSAVVAHAVADRRLVVATETGRLLGRASSGDIAWNVPGAVGQPFVAEETVFVRGAGGSAGQAGVTALSLADGSRRWHRPVGGDGWLLVADGHCYLNRGSGVVRCLG